MRPVRLLTTVSYAAALTACAAPPPVDPAANVSAVSSLTSDGTKGTSTIFAVFPCNLSDKFVPSALKGDSLVLIDGKEAAALTSCEYRKITIPAGKHAIRMGEKIFDIGGLFGNGPEFALPANATAYFAVHVEYNGGNSYTRVLSETSAAEGKSLIATIDAETKAR